MGWLILLAVIGLIWIALMQPVWIKVVFEPGRSDLQIRYLWFRITPRPSAKSKTEKPEREKRPRFFNRFAFGELKNLLPKILNAFKRAARYFLKKIEVRQFELRGRLGLDDPIATGLAYGAYCALRPQIPRLHEQIHIEIEPDFLEERALLSGEIESGVRPSSLISSAAILLWHVPKWRLWRAMRRKRS